MGFVPGEAECERRRRLPPGAGHQTGKDLGLKLGRKPEGERETGGSGLVAMAVKVGGATQGRGAERCRCLSRSHPGCPRGGGQLSLETEPG